MTNRRLEYLALGTVVMLAGCTAGVGMEDTMLPGKTAAYKPPLKLAAVDAGINLPGPVADESALKTVVSSTVRRYGSTRSDPFALTSVERTFENEQSTERVFTNVGFTSQFTPPAEVETPRSVITETQPYRRLSGIIVGDSVLAIMESPESPAPELGGLIIRPGMTIPNSSWRVKSIDQSKATLVRSGNIEPKQITVRLEVNPNAPTTPANTGPTGGFPGGPPGGFPGGPPPGFGGPPGGFPGGPPGGFPGGFPGGGGRRGN